MWALIDNYDSFTWILHHYLLIAGADCRVFRNDAISVEELARMRPERIIISPGPETPWQAGITMEIIARFHKEIPILGVCLGHQALGMFFGAELRRIPYPMHGKISNVTQSKHRLFQGVSSPFSVMRYHSLGLTAMDKTALKVLATSEDDKQIMVLEHQEFPCVGIQFHPESVGTPDGQLLINNWTAMY